MVDSGNTDGVLKVNEVIKPYLLSENVPKLLQDWYGLAADTVKTLVSYDDLNFLIKVKQSPVSNCHIDTPHTAGYVMKVLNSLDSCNPNLVKGQNNMMLYLSQKGYQCPLPIKNIHGNYMSLLNLGNDDNCNEVKKHIVRLLSFVPSTVLCTVPLTAALTRDMGRYTAQTQIDLVGFTDPAIASRQFVWMMANTLELRKFLHVITDPEHLSMVTTAVNSWEAKVFPVMDKLPKGYVHGDLNEQNFLVTPTAETTDSKEPSYAMSGIIDFGDISVSCYVFDLAIAVMSVLTLDKTVVEAGQVVAGYCSVKPLQQDEWEVLWDCVCARLCVSLVLGAYNHSLDPTNGYLLTTSANGWRALRSMLHTGRRNTVAAWRSVVTTNE